jgi:hypothetical protein
MGDTQLKKSKRTETAPLPVADAKRLDFQLFVADETEVLQLNLDHETAIRVSNAVNDLLARLPDVADDDLCDSVDGAHNTPQETETLLVPISQLPALPEFPDIRWRKVKQLPGYRGRPIRSLGNDIFSYFPCFRAFAVEAKARKLDGQGEILVLSTLMHDNSSVDCMARTIAESGVFLNSGELNFGENIPGYRPRIMLFMNQKWTFLLVQDKRETGAPLDANYIYAWPGGRMYYKSRIAFLPKKKVEARKAETGCIRETQKLPDYLY